MIGKTLWEVFGANKSLDTSLDSSSIMEEFRSNAMAVLEHQEPSRFSVQEAPGSGEAPHRSGPPQEVTLFSAMLLKRQPSVDS